MTCGSEIHPHPPSKSCASLINIFQSLKYLTWRLKASVIINFIIHHLSIYTQMFILQMFHSTRRAILSMFTILSIPVKFNFFFSVLQVWCISLGDFLMNRETSSWAQISCINKNWKTNRNFSIQNLIRWGIQTMQQTDQISVTHPCNLSNSQKWDLINSLKSSELLIICLNRIIDKLFPPHSEKIFHQILYPFCKLNQLSDGWIMSEWVKNIPWHIRSLK